MLDMLELTQSIESALGQSIQLSQSSNPPAVYAALECTGCRREIRDLRLLEIMRYIRSQL